MWGTTWVSERRHDQIATELEQEWRAGAQLVHVEEGPATAMVEIPAFGDDYRVPLLEGPGAAIVGVLVAVALIRQLQSEPSSCSSSPTCSKPSASKVARPSKMSTPCAPRPEQRHWQTLIAADTAASNRPLER